MSYDKVRLLAQPTSFVHHAATIAERFGGSRVVPSMTENEVRFQQGITSVVEHVQQQSQEPSSEGFNEAFVTGLIELYKAPVFDYGTPMACIMFWAGVYQTLDSIVAYYNEERS